MNLESKSIEALGSSQNREIQKARILGCYSNAADLVKKPAVNNQAFQKAEPVRAINQVGAGTPKRYTGMDKILADIDITVKRVLATGRKLGIK